ncbi:MAG: hypothetical protein SWI22_14415 [Pseudomonadota bacterium]|nr:hypothetical protein [Pseudomonadota bacterium]
MLVVLAAMLWPASMFVSWIMATPLGFGTGWSEYSLWGQIFFLAPLLVLLPAAALGAFKRRLWLFAAALLAAPFYQALYLGASSLLAR